MIFLDAFEVFTELNFHRSIFKWLAWPTMNYIENEFQMIAINFSFFVYWWFERWFSFHSFVRSFFFHSPIYLFSNTARSLPHVLMREMKNTIRRSQEMCARKNVYKQRAGIVLEKKKQREVINRDRENATVAFWDACFDFDAVRFSKKIVFFPVCMFV